MPGIVGMISQKPPEECQRLVQTMVGTMRHEKFHTTGIFSAPDLNIFAGWVAHKNSFADRQVFQNETQDIALVFAGECFAGAGTQARLKQNGHHFSASGGDWLVPLYEEKGERFFESLNG